MSIDLTKFHVPGTALRDLHSQRITDHIRGRGQDPVTIVAAARSKATGWTTVLARTVGGADVVALIQPDSMVFSAVVKPAGTGDHDFFALLDLAR